MMRGGNGLVYEKRMMNGWVGAACGVVNEYRGFWDGVEGSQRERASGMHPSKGVDVEPSWIIKR